MWRAVTNFAATTLCAVAKTASGSPLDVLTAEGEIVAHLGVEHGGRGVERAHHVGDGGERLVVDLDEGGALLRRGARVVATTATTGSPTQHARSSAIGCSGGDFSPLRWASTATHGVQTFARSAPVKTRRTPRTSFAAAVSIEVMRAWAKWERTKATCTMRGSTMSST